MGETLSYLSAVCQIVLPHACRVGKNSAIRTTWQNPPTVSSRGVAVLESGDTRLGDEPTQEVNRLPTFVRASAHACPILVAASVGVNFPSITVPLPPERCRAVPP